jgi:hypothetical protein
MIYIDFNTHENEAYLSILSLINKDNLICIPPKKKSYEMLKLKEELSLLYLGYSKLEVEIFQKKLWAKIVLWCQINCPHFHEKVIKFCSFHLAYHFSLNYISTSNIIRNLINSHKYSKYTIICSEEMLTIEGGWCSSFISLLAAVEVLGNANAEYYLLETSSGVLNKLINTKSLTYAPSILDSFQPIDSQKKFKEHILNSKYVSYQFTNRFNFFTAYENSISIHPKSIVNDICNVGSYLQFPKETSPLPSFITWDDFSLMQNSFSKNLESNFFNSLGQYIFPKIISSMKNINDISLNSNNTKTLILEEVVDLEAIPLITLFHNSNQEIYVTQHSTNPILSPLLSTDKNPFVSKIFSNSFTATLLYENEFPYIEILRNPLTISKHDSFKEFTFKKIITIIENDYFRKMGFPFNIQIIYQEISIFINKLINENSEFEILWRQRTNDFNPILELLRNEFPNIIFHFDNSFSLDNISNISNISIGFGSNSSLAIQLLEKGVISYFGSTNYSDQEYVPNVNLLHEKIGPENSAISIASSIKNSNSTYYETLHRQTNILNLM